MDRTLYLKRSVTLIELLIAVLLLGVIVLAVGNIDLFSRYQVTNASRRAMLQNELSYVLETISANVARATGDLNNHGITLSGTTLTVRVDNAIPATPNNYADDTIMTYALSGNKITENGTAMNVRAIIPAGGFICVLMPDATIASGVDIYLQGRYSPTQAISADNPEIELRSRVYSRAASTN